MSEGKGESTVLFEIDNGVGLISINRPSARNALNMEVKRALADVIVRAGDDESVRAVVLTGADGVFCSGGDIAEMALNDSPPRSRSRLAWLLAEVAVALAELEKPTVAAIEGHAHGAGLSLALACDVIITAEDAQLSCAFTAMGLVPDCGALYFLPRRLPMGIAKEVVFTGRRFSGADAVAMGLANSATAPGEALATARALAERLAAGATVALGLAKRLLEASTSSTLRELAQAEAFAQAITYSTQDHLAAREAFLNKSRPTFTGR